MTPVEVEAAIEEAQGLAKRWLCGSPHVLSGKDFQREIMRLMTLSSVKPEGSLPGNYSVRADDRAPSFGFPGGCHLVYDDHKGAKLIEEAAKGDADADAVLCGFAADFVNRGCVMPDRLREFIGAKLFAQSEGVARRRGRRPNANSRRNVYIAFTVFRLQRLGIYPTRNETTQSESGCSIIAQALDRIGLPTSEQNVAKVWSKFMHLTESDLLREMIL